MKNSLKKINNLSTFSKECSELLSAEFFTSQLVDQV
jgi:hypothetical protein